MLLLSEGWAGEAWEPAYKVTMFLLHPKLKCISPPTYFYIIYSFSRLSLSFSPYIIYTYSVFNGLLFFLPFLLFSRLSCSLFTSFHPTCHLLLSPLTWYRFCRSFVMIRSAAVLSAPDSALKYCVHNDRGSETRASHPYSLRLRFMKDPLADAT